MARNIPLSQRGGKKFGLALRSLPAPKVSSSTRTKASGVIGDLKSQSKSQATKLSTGAKSEAKKLGASAKSEAKKMGKEAKEEAKKIGKESKEIATAAARETATSLARELPAIALQTSLLLAQQAQDKALGFFGTKKPKDEEEEEQEGGNQVWDQLTPVAELSESERKKLVLSSLSSCLPVVGNDMYDFGDFIVSCISQALGELYIPDSENMELLIEGLEGLRDSGFDLSDPENIKILLYGTKSNDISKQVDLLEGYDQVLYALENIIKGQKINSAELEQLERLTVESMKELNQHGGGCGTSGFYFGKTPSHPVWGSQAPPLDLGLYGSHGRNN